MVYFDNMEFRCANELLANVCAPSVSPLPANTICHIIHKQYVRKAAFREQSYDPLLGDPSMTSWASSTETVMATEIGMEYCSRS